MPQKLKVSVLDLKSSLKALKWPISGTKEVLIERLGRANLPQSFDTFHDTPVTIANPKSNSFKFSKAGPVLKRIPKGSRIQLCRLLTEILDAVTSKNDFECWEKLLSFPNICLSSTNRGGKKKKITCNSCKLKNRSVHE